MRVAVEFMKADEELHPAVPTINYVAQKAGVNWRFAESVRSEMLSIGTVLDPEETDIEKIREVCGFLKPEHELHLLALRVENPARSNIDYCYQMMEMYPGLKISPRY